MSWKKPFEQHWPDPVDDLRQRFGIDIPSFTLRELATYTTLYIVTMVLVVSLFEVVL